MKSTECRIWAFDFDGTLSHIVPDRNAAAIDPTCEALLMDLADDPNQIVAVVSSRSLEDLRERLQMENVAMAGASGLEWWLPGGQWFGPNKQATDRLRTERQRLVPSLERLQEIPGVEFEDKTWSAAIHFRGVAEEDRIVVARELEQLHVRHGVALHYGPEVAEVQFLQEVSKEIAVKTLVTIFAPRQTGRNILYAGDDQNDAQAMRWVLNNRGVVYIVGSRISVHGAKVVSDPTALAFAIRRRYNLNGANSNNQDREMGHE